MDKSTTESIVAKILEDLLNDLPMENQENEEDLDEVNENQPSDDSDEDLSGYASDIESQTSDDSYVEPFVMFLVFWYSDSDQSDSDMDL